VLVAAFLVPALLVTSLADGSSVLSAESWAAATLALGIAASAGAAARTAAFGIRGWPLLLLGAAVGVVLILGGAV